MAETEIHKRDFAQTLARGLSCLEVLADSPHPASCSEIARRMGVSRAAARRILLTLQHLGYVVEDRAFYAPSPKVLSLGRGMLGKGSIWTSAAPETVVVADQFNEPCSISVLEGLDILFVCRDSTRRIYSSRLGVGDRLPAHCSASGKVLLASLPEGELTQRLKGAALQRHGPASIVQPTKLKAALKAVRQAGFALAVDEMEDGTLSVAVPLHERRGRTIAAMSVASHRSRLTPKDLETKVLPQLRDAAGRVERLIGDYQDRMWAVF